jgi:hypothetical protein
MLVVRSFDLEGILIGLMKRDLQNKKMKQQRVHSRLNGLDDVSVFSFKFLLRYVPGLFRHS